MGLPALGTVHLQRPMRSPAVAAVEVLGEYSLQVPLVQRDRVVEALRADTADQSRDVGWPVSLDHAPGHRRLGEVDADPGQLADGTRGAPPGVGGRQAADESAHLGCHGRSTRFARAAHLAPVPSEPPPSPGDHGLRLDEDERFSPARPGAGEPAPEQAIGGPDAEVAGSYAGRRPPGGAAPGSRPALRTSQGRERRPARGKQERQQPVRAAAQVEVAPRVPGRAGHAVDEVPGVPMRWQGSRRSDALTQADTG
jgi:hypothetical protein